MRSTIPFNDDWLYAPQEFSTSARDDQFQPVTLPHSNILLPYHNFDNLDYQFISTYRKRFTLPEPLNGRRLYIDFDGAMTSAQVTINGHNLGEHDGGYVPFSFDLTDHLRDGENLLQVRLDSTERPDVPPNGYMVDYLTFGGIYREVWLNYYNPVYITDVFVRPSGLLTDAPKLEIDVHIRNFSSTAHTFSVYSHINGGIVREDHSVEMLAEEENEVTLNPGDHVVTLTFKQFPKVELWSLDNPRRYGIHLSLYGEKGGVDDDYGAFPYGFREAIFKDDGFYLNGERVKLIGLDRHQTYPYIGGAAPARLQRKDADILKYELGINIVRTSHYPQSPHFLDRCDEIGLLVLEEIPGWQFIGDSDWKALSLRDVEAMIVRDRNHPSIVLWGVRINESWDDEAFYKATNKLAHDLDPTRQTGGVRNFIESQFLEDVFTYNDFSNTIVEPRVTPHLVTEFSGHMFPTKTFDQEERQIEHALRHTRIQDKSFGMPNVTGAIGWCAFDYNTHLNFGSGDRICYHGVMDIFRLPKFAAYFYETQSAKQPVVRVAGFWTPGDRSASGNDPLWVYSNCDEIAVYIGDELHSRCQPDHAEFPHLPHPPFRVGDLSPSMIWGEHFQDLHVVGYQQGKPVAEQRIAADGLPKQLILRADDAELHADGADMTRITFKIADKYGNRLPFAIAAIYFEVNGPAELVGENPFPLVGGQGAIYVKASRQPGVVTVCASAPRLPVAEIKITLV